jgi:hypothetical protein
MVGSHDVKEFDVRGRKPLVNPFGVGAVYKAFRAVAHGTSFPTGIAPDTSTGLLFKIFPSFFGRLLFKLFDLRMCFDK